MNRFRGFIAVALLLGPAFQAVYGYSLIETPMLRESVQNGDLPPVVARIPTQPQVVTFDGEFEAGRHGGQLRVLMGKQKDIRQLVIYGYARLVGYTPDLELQPDILESLEVVENRIFTLHLRKGHRGPMATRLRARIFAITGKMWPTMQNYPGVVWRMNWQSMVKRR
jgi:peptide/nickel transport system substrate-binding protein